MIYTRRSSVVTVRRYRDNKNTKIVAAVTAKELNSAVKRPEWYQFSSASLAHVFNQLSTYYQVQIYYYPHEVSKSYHSCKIEKSDSLEHILRDIALLNGFTITRKNGAYYVQKKK